MQHIWLSKDLIAEKDNYETSSTAGYSDLKSLKTDQFAVNIFYNQFTIDM